MDDIAFVRFGGEDVVRHQLVQRIVAAYGEYSSGEAATGIDLPDLADVPVELRPAAEVALARPGSPRDTSRSSSSAPGGSAS